MHLWMYQWMLMKLLIWSYQIVINFNEIKKETNAQRSCAFWTSQSFYSDIEIDSTPFSFCYFNENNEIVNNTHKDRKVVDFVVEVEDSGHNENENRNPLHEHRYIENETFNHE